MTYRVMRPKVKLALTPNFPRNFKKTRKISSHTSVCCCLSHRTWQLFKHKKCTFTTNSCRFVFWAILVASVFKDVVTSTHQHSKWLKLIKVKLDSELPEPNPQRYASLVALSLYSVVLGLFTTWLLLVAVWQIIILKLLWNIEQVKTQTDRPRIPQGSSAVCSQKRKY